MKLQHGGHFEKLAQQRCGGVFFDLNPDGLLYFSVGFWFRCDALSHSLEVDLEFGVCFNQ